MEDTKKMDLAKVKDGPSLAKNEQKYGKGARRHPSKPSCFKGMLRVFAIFQVPLIDVC